MSSTFDLTLEVESITTESGDPVEFPVGLKTDSVESVGGTTTFTDNCLFEGDVTVGDITDPKTLTVFRDVIVSRRVTAANLMEGVKYNVSYTQLTTAGTVQTLTLGTIGVGWMPVRAHVQVLQPFDASGLSGLTWTVGWSNGATFGVDVDGLLLAGDSDGTATGFYQRENSHKGVALDGTEDYPLQNDNAPTITFTSAGANLNAMTQGVLRVTIFYARDPQVL